MENGIYNETAHKEFGKTGRGSIYRLCTSIYGWQIRERSTGGYEDTCFRGSLEECEKKAQEYIDAGCGVVVNK